MTNDSVRTAARLAARLGSPWHAVYVETPRLHRLPEAQRRGILQTLKLAGELGAETATLAAPDEVQAVLAYAREHNLGKIVIGRRQRESFWRRGGRQALAGAAVTAPRRVSGRRRNRHRPPIH